MRSIERTRAFKRDYRRESRGRYGKRLDERLNPVVTDPANDIPLAPHHLREPPLVAAVLRQVEVDVGLRELPTLRAFVRERVDHVAHDVVTKAVANEHHRELAEHLGDEASGTSFGQICTTEVGCGGHKVRSPASGKDSTMQVNDAGPTLRPGPGAWELRQPHSPARPPLRSGHRNSS